MLKRNLFLRNKVFNERGSSVTGRTQFSKLRMSSIEPSILPGQFSSFNLELLNDFYDRLPEEELLKQIEQDFLVAFKQRNEIFPYNSAEGAKYYVEREVEEQNV